VGTVAAAGASAHEFVDGTVVGLLPDEAYAYRIVAVKQVARAAGEPIEVTTASEPVPGRAFDTAVPAPPADLQLTRVAPATISVRWSTSEPCGWLLRREAPGGGATVALVVGGDAGAATLDGGRWRYAFDDVGVGPELGWRYLVTITNRLGRIAPVAVAVETPP
jgi:hypothetical protein